jgi:hypothetical protein
MQTTLTGRSEYRATNNEHALFLPSYPLNDLIRALSQRGSTRVSRRHSIQFEQRRAPRQRYTCCVRLVMHFERCRLVMQAHMQFVVEVEESVSRTW